MNGTQVTHFEEHGALNKVATGGWAAEAVGGIAAIVLSIIGLAGGFQATMAAISVILIGASLFIAGGATAASYRQLIARLEGSSAGTTDFGEAMTVEFLAGIAGIALGILALLGISATVLVSAAVIVFGSAFLLGSGAAANLNSWSASLQYTRDETRQMVRQATGTGIGGQVLLGMAAIVLGILAVLNINSMVLNLVALLCLGVAVLLSGTVFGSKSMGAMSS
jgi:hypothetical protein